MMRWRNSELRKKQIEKLVHPGTKILVFDTETEGLDPLACHIIQFSGELVKVEDDYSLTTLEAYDMFINPGRPLPEKIIELTGITDEILMDEEQENKAVLKIIDILKKADVLSAYNSKFDIGMLKGMFMRCEISFRLPEDLDVLEWARDHMPKGMVENHKLGTVFGALYPNAELDFHRADNDVRATVMVMEVLLKAYKKMPKVDENKLPLMVERAYLFINPYQRSQKRINLILSKGNDGDIFYDITAKEWSCKDEESSKQLFEEADMAKIEDQILKKYPYYDTIDELAYGWIRYRAKQ